MANHKSSKKRIRQTVTKRAHNRLYHKTARNAVKALRNTSEKSAAEALLPKVTSMLDKLAKHNIIHKNKAGNLKGALQLHVNALEAGSGGIRRGKENGNRFIGNGSRCLSGGRRAGRNGAGRAEISCLNELFGNSRSNVPCRPGFGLAKPHNPA